MASSEQAQPTTFWGRQVVRPSWTELIVSFVWLIALGVCDSGPGMGFPGVNAFFWVAVGLLLAWVVRGLFVVVGVFFRPAPARTWAQRLAWFVLPVVLALGIANSLTSATFRLRVLLSRPALLARVDAAPTDSEGDPQRMGLFRVERIERHGECTAFVTGGDAEHAVGVLYCPPEASPPQSTWHYVLEPLFGCWYGFWQGRNPPPDSVVY